MAGIDSVALVTSPVVAPPQVEEYAVKGVATEHSSLLLGIDGVVIHIVKVGVEGGIEP